MPSRSFSATVVREGGICYIPVPFDPKTVFGTVRAPVVVTIGDYTFRSRIVAMGGPVCVGLRKSHREAAGLEGGETVKVTLALDTAERTITPPADLLRELKRSPDALAAWQALSFTHQREHVEAIEDAKKPETRTRRIEKALASLAARTPRPARKAAHATAGNPATGRSGGTHSARARTSRTTSKL